MNTLRAQILDQELVVSHLGVEFSDLVFGRGQAVQSIAQALSVAYLTNAVRALERNNSRRESNEALHQLGIFVKVLNEIIGDIQDGAIPKTKLHIAVVGLYNL